MYHKINFFNWYYKNSKKLALKSFLKKYNIKIKNKGGGSEMKRTLGKSGIEVSALGLGCWPIGGEWKTSNGGTMRFGKIDDVESIKAIQRAVDLGVNFFDTADIYGRGHSEILLGKALKGIRNKVVIATKFGYSFDEVTKEDKGINYSSEYIKKACIDSLRRLNTDYIDLYQLHLWEIPLEDAKGVFNTLEDLKKEGLIRSYGWSTDHPQCIDFLIKNTNAVAIQHQFNILINADKILKICNDYNIASINRSPLGMGLLSGKFNKDTVISKDDIRGNNIDWMIYFKDGKPNYIFLEKLDKVREILTSNGRTLAQGALAYLWAKSEKTIPIPGFTSIKQVEENAKAMEFGPLKKNEVEEIETIIGERISIV